MKKFTSMFLSLVLALCTVFTAVPMVSPVEAAVADAGYEFTDMAYSPSLGMYVAVAKNLTDANHAAKLYVSTDGLAWTNSVFSFDKGKNFSNVNTRQSIVWWEGGKQFVVALGNNVFCSQDGLIWEENHNMDKYGDNNTAINNIFVETNGDQLLILGGRRMRMFNPGSEAGTAYTEYIINPPTSFNAHVLGMRPADENGIITSYATYAFSSTAYAPYVTWTPADNNTYTNSQSLTYPGVLKYNNLEDIIYNQVDDNWVILTGKNEMRITKGSNIPTAAAFAAEPDANVTAMAINGQYIIAGTSTGNVYYTANTTAGISSETVWTNIPAEGTANTEEIRNITFTDPENFIVLSQTNIFTGTVNGYSNIKEYKKLGRPAVTGGNPFKGIKLIGGAYSPELGIYIVYGNAADGGRIFTSENGTDWELTYSGAILLADIADGAVWWPAQEIFVVRAAQGNSGLLWYSHDGYKWVDAITKTTWKADLAISNDALYTIGSSDRLPVYKYTELNDEKREEVPIDITVNHYASRLAMSNETAPSIFIADGYQGTILDGSTGKWVDMATVGAYGTVIDVEYSKNMDKFIATQKNQWPTVIVSKDGTSIDGPKVSDVQFKAVKTNNSMLLFGGNNGKLYTATDSAAFSKETALRAIPLAQSGFEENTLAVTNIVTGKNGEFLVTVSDNTDSDILFTDASATSYWKVSDNIKVDNLNAGETIVVKVQSVNNTADAVPFTMITAIYDGGKLIQTAAEEKNMAASTSTCLTQEITLNENVPQTAKMKVYLWNSLTGMQPVSESTGFFQ